jgi:hypothetical protein
MKRSFYGLLLALSLMLTPGVAGAHDYDRENSDHPLRYVAYVLHPVGIAAEYLVLRPIHWVVSQPNCDIIFGHDTADDEDKDFMKWE